MSDIKDWYVKNYPSDPIGKEIKHVGFRETYQGMKQGKDFYKTIGVQDSVVRERVFNQMAKENKKSYNDIYNTWMK